MKYRDYMLSDSWRNLRRMKLIETACRCEMCGVCDKSNDVHHVDYKNLTDCLTSDLRTLCRDCHDLVHSTLRDYPSINKLPTAKLRWKQILSILSRLSCDERKWNPLRGQGAPSKARAKLRTSILVMASDIELVQVPRAPTKRSHWVRKGGDYWYDGDIWRVRKNRVFRIS